MKEEIFLLSDKDALSKESEVLLYYTFTTSIQNIIFNESHSKMKYNTNNLCPHFIVTDKIIVPSLYKNCFYLSPYTLTSLFLMSCAIGPKVLQTFLSVKRKWLSPHNSMTRDQK